MPVEGRNPGFRVPTTQQGKAAIDDESSNARTNPGAATEAIPEGQAGADLPLLCPLRQSVSMGHSGSCLSARQIEWWGCGCGQNGFRGHRVVPREAVPLGVATRTPGKALST